MTKLREDVRTAFELEQKALGEVGDARHRLIQDSVAAREHVGRRAQRAAAIAAVLIAALVIATLALVHGNSGQQPIPGTSPKANATPLRNAINVPDSTPLVLYYDPVDSYQVDGMTWDGKSRGKVSLAGITLSPNPANSRFGDSIDVTDRTGRVLSRGRFGFNDFWGTWADDEVHFCLLVPFRIPGPNGVSTTLQLVDSTDGSARNVVKVGKYDTQGGVWVAACSIEFDRAVVVSGTPLTHRALQYWVIQMSTGTILWTHTFDPNALPVDIVSSRDGRFIAENQASVNVDATTSEYSTVVGPDGVAIARKAGAVYGFSWDGSLAVLDPGDAQGPAQIVRISNGKIVWSGPRGAGFGVTDVYVQPNGADLAVAINNPAYPSYPVDAPIGRPRADVYIVAPNGRVITTVKAVYALYTGSRVI